MAEGGDVWSAQAASLELVPVHHHVAAGGRLNAATEPPPVSPENRAPCQHANVFSHVQRSGDHQQVKASGCVCR